MFVYLSAQLILIKFDFVGYNKNLLDNSGVQEIYIREVWATFLSEEMIELELSRISDCLDV